MKAIMISIKPKWCAKIMNGEKTIEVRKNKALASAIQKLINENGYADIYVYCSLKKHIKDYLQIENGKYVCSVPKDYEKTLNGKVLFKFRCYKVEEIKYVGYGYRPAETPQNTMAEKSCIYDFNELDKYLQGKNGYAIHISDLEIFDRPKELSEFKRCTEKTCIYAKCHKYMHCLKPLTKAPQNMCYVEVE